MISSAATIASAEAARTAFPFGVVLASRVLKGMGERSGSGGYLDLRVEDVLHGLDALGADLRGELHRELRALDRHHGLRRVRRLAGRELLRRGGGVLLER